MPATGSANLAARGALEPGAGEALAATSTPPRGCTRPRSATSSTRRSRPAAAARPRGASRGLPRLVPMLARSLHRYVTPAVQGPPARADPAVPGRVPRQLAVCHAGHVPPDEHARPRGRRALPEGRHHRRDRRHRARQAEQRGVRIRTGTAADRILTDGAVGATPARDRRAHREDGDVGPADVVVARDGPRGGRAPAAAARAAHLRRRRGGDGARPARARCSCCSASAARCRSCCTTRCCSRRTGTRTSPRSCRSAARPCRRCPTQLSIYVCRPSATDDVAPPGHENLFVLVPMTRRPGDRPRRRRRRRDPPRWRRSPTARSTRSRSWLGHPGPPRAHRGAPHHRARATSPTTSRAWQGTALGPAHTLGQSALFRAGNVSRKVDGLLFAGGSTIPGIGLPMCLISAELVLKRLRGDTTAGPLPEPVPASVATA